MAEPTSIHERFMTLLHANPDVRCGLRPSSRGRGLPPACREPYPLRASPRPPPRAEQGVADEMLQRVFGSEYKELVNVIQPLLNQVCVRAADNDGTACGALTSPAEPSTRSKSRRPEHRTSTGCCRATS